MHIEWKRHRILTSPNTYCSGNLVILVRWRFSTTCNLLWISFKEFKFSLRRILPSILESKYCDCVLSREWLIMPKFLSKALKLELLLSSDFASSYWLTFAYITVFPLCVWSSSIPSFLFWISNWSLCVRLNLVVSPIIGNYFLLKLLFLVFWPQNTAIVVLAQRLYFSIKLKKLPGKMKKLSWVELHELREERDGNAHF